MPTVIFINLKHLGQHPRYTWRETGGFYWISFQYGPPVHCDHYERSFSCFNRLLLPGASSEARRIVSIWINSEFPLIRPNCGDYAIIDCGTFQL